MKNLRNTKKDNFSIEKIPDMRKIIIDTVEEGRKRHHMKGLIELDVTKALEIIHEKKYEIHICNRRCSVIPRQRIGIGIHWRVA